MTKLSLNFINKYNPRKIYRRIKKASGRTCTKFLFKGLKFFYNIKNRMVGNAEPTISTGQSKKQKKLLDFMRIWGDSTVLYNRVGQTQNLVSTPKTHSSDHRKIKNINSNLEIYKSYEINNVQNGDANNHDVFNESNHTNTSLLSRPEFNYHKTPSLYNRHKYNKLELDGQSRELYSQSLKKNMNSCTVNISNYNSPQTSKISDMTIQNKYDISTLIEDLENDTNLRNKFISCLQKSTFLSNIIKSTFYQKDLSNDIRKPYSSSISQSTHFMVYPKLETSYSRYNGTDISLFNINKFIQPRSRINPKTYSIKMNNSLTHIKEENETLSDEEKSSRCPSPSLTPTLSKGSPNDQDYRNKEEQAFDISSKRIEDELERQLELLNINQQKLDMTLIKYQTEAKAGLDLLSSNGVILTRPLKAKASLSQELEIALGHVSRTVPQLFSELLDDDLIYLAKYSSDPVRIEHYPVLSYEDQNILEKALHYGPKDEILVRGFGADIKRSDLNTLEHINWLNDEIMNFYLNMITERSKNHEPGYHSAHSFSTFFFTQLSTKGYQSVRRWTKKLDIFAKELIIVPVHIGAHWCMGIIDMVAKVIIYFDSLYSEPHDYYLSILLNYLEEESLDKKKVEFDSSDWKLINALNVPQQTNGSDCGMFALKYAEFCSRRENFTFSQVHMSYFRQRMILEIINKKLSPL